jgi:hypothetical protein
MQAEVIQDPPRAPELCEELDGEVPLVVRGGLVELLHLEDDPFWGKVHVEPEMSCFDGENGTNDAFAVQSLVADFLPDWAILFITVPDFLFMNKIFFACFGGLF